VVPVSVRDVIVTPLLVRETLGTAAVTATVAVPDLVVSWVEVAVMVTVPAVLGAVRSPEELIVPALALQLTAEL
jgi:small basic protein